MNIERDLYLQRLIRKKDNGMIKVITGVRRSGKSYLLFVLYYDYLISQGIPEDHIITIALDDIEYQNYCDPAELYRYLVDQTKDGSKYYIFLDEVQYAISREEMKNPDQPIRLYGALNGLLRRRNVDVYVTGSNSKFLSTDIMTEFRGRGDEVHIAPLAFSEYFPAHGGTREEAWQDYAFYGGLPHILAEKTDEDKAAYLSRLHSEIYLKDIVERYKLKNQTGLEELMKLIASAIGSLTNAKKIADTFAGTGTRGLSTPTIQSYLNALQESFIIEKAERYDIKGRKYLSTPSKYYYTDIGLRNALLGFRQFEETHIMENIIYNELIYRGYAVDVGVVKVQKDGTHHQLEVDFVASRGSRRFYLQSAYALPDQAKMDQEQASLINIPDSFRKIIIVHQNQKPWHNEQGILILNLFDFLLNPESLEW